MSNRATRSTALGVLVAGTVLAVTSLTATNASGSTFNGDPEIIAVGDMACAPADPYFNGGVGDATHCRQAEVSSAALIDNAIGTADRLVGLGDYQYGCTTPEDYAASYNPSWGRFGGILVSPSPGNHEYVTASTTCPIGAPNAENYFAYFGAAAHPESHGEYAYTMGSWLLISLNSECSKTGVGGCKANSKQTLWLKNVLAQNTQPCIAAYWHRPYYSGVALYPVGTFRPWMQVLYSYGADLVLNGHIHNYQRFAPRNPTGDALDPMGPTEYIVGTGGENLATPKTTAQPQPVVKSKTFGYLRMALEPSGWSAQFVDTLHGNVVTDTSSGTCH